jgi:hypothetical protein
VGDVVFAKCATTLGSTARGHAPQATVCMQQSATGAAIRQSGWVAPTSAGRMLGSAASYRGEARGRGERAFREIPTRPHATVCFTDHTGCHGGEGGGGGGRSFCENAQRPSGRASEGAPLGLVREGVHDATVWYSAGSRPRSGWVFGAAPPSPGSLRDPTLVRSSRPKPAGGRGECGGASGAWRMGAAHYPLSDRACDPL